MSIFVDTSAFLALLSAEDTFNKKAGQVLDRLAETGDELVCTNYVLVESISLIQHRYGMEGIHDFRERFIPALRVIWLEPADHENAFHFLLEANRRNLSLVDCASFETMRRLGIETVFTFDEHFRDQGFKTIP